MSNQVTETQGKLIVSLQGEVDLEHAPTVRRLLLDCVRRKKDILVELAGVAYIDSSGIASLIEALQAARAQGTALALVAVSAQAMRVLQLARLDQVFPIHADIAGALRAGA